MLVENKGKKLRKQKIVVPNKCKQTNRQKQIEP